MKTDKQLGILVSVFIIVTIGIVLLQATADSISETDDTPSINETIAITSTSFSVANETVTIASEIAQTGNISIVDLTFFGNSSVNTNSVSFNISLHVNLSRAGEINVDPTSFADGPYNITYTYSSLGVGTTANDDITVVAYFGNSTVHTNLAGLAIDSDVNWSSESGAIRINTLNFSDGNYEINYTYEGDMYVGNSAARSLLNLIVLFFAIGIMALAYIWVKKGLEQMQQ